MPFTAPQYSFVFSHRGWTTLYLQHNLLELNYWTDAKSWISHCRLVVIDLFAMEKIFGSPLVSSSSLSLSQIMSLLLLLSLLFLVRSVCIAIVQCCPHTHMEETSLIMSKWERRSSFFVGGLCCYCRFTPSSSPHMQVCCVHINVRVFEKWMNESDAASVFYVCFLMEYAALLADTKR